MIPRCRWRILLLVGVAGLVPLCGIAPLVFAVDADPARLTQLRTNDSALPRQTLQTVTNVSQFLRLVERGQRVVYPVRLEGVVCAASPEKGILLLKDEFGVAQIEMNMHGQSVQPGARVLVTGIGVVEGMKLRFGAVPLVDNDGTHAMVERSGTVYMKAGRHPIRVVWFNGAGELGLEAFYEGPDLSRQMIPASVLFREQVDPKSGITNFVQGLNYRCYEGTNWSYLPDFSQLTNVKAGTVTNFDVSVINRTNNVALEFIGYVELAREGLYTFSMSSDDGSRMFVGESQARLEVLGSGPPPVPRPIVVSQALSAQEDHQWAEVEGTVTFVSEQLDGYELELSSGAGRMRLKVAADSGDTPIFLLNSQVRAKGICLGTYTSEGQKVAGAMFVAGWKQIEPLQVAAEHWNESPLVTIGSLLANNRTRTNEVIVRVQAKLRSATPGAQWVLEDDSGQMPVEGIPALPEAVGTRVELLGKLSWKGINCVLQNVFYRQMMATTNGTGGALPILTTAKQIHYLIREEAKRAYPVRIRGVVISTISWRNSFVLQDATHGVFVQGILAANPPHLGDIFEVEGVTDPGDFAPTVLAERVNCLGAGRMPEPLHPNRNQLINGSLDGQYVELQGIVTAIEPNGVTLLTLAGKYKVDMVDVLSQNLTQFESALVRIKGCFLSSWDAQTKQIRIGQIRIFNGSINVDEPAPADLFAAPVKTAAELLLFDARASALKRIKVSGQIIHQRAAEYYMMNGTNGLRFFLKKAMPLKLGDQVEVVGFPELGGASPVLREAIARKTGTASLPKAEPLPVDALLSADHDATLVRIESQLVGFRTNQTEQVLEMQAGPRTYLARLDNRNGLVQQMHLGSRLQLTAVYAGQGGDRSEGRDIDSFELLLNSPADIKVLAYPSWWTPERILMMVGALAGVLLLALAWIRGLRRQVEQQTRKLKNEIEEHKRTETQLIKEIEERKRTQVELEEKKVSLEKEIEERKRMEREIENTHKQLLEVSRQAGQAEVATNVLHNVGNVLNSVNTSAGVIGEKLRASKLPGMTRILELLEKNRGDLPGFFASDVRAQQFQNYLKTLNQILNEEQLAALGELACLTRNIDHIKDIVAMQQSYAMVSGVTESILPADLLEDSVRMNASSLARHDIEVVREFQDVPPVTVEKHKALQILVNLIRNAKQACDEAKRTDKRVTLRVTNGDGRVRLSVSDNGIGIPPENLTRIFNHGFTTRKDGHGFGLHSGALAAKEMGGALSIHSDGPGRGATFTLELPAQTQEKVL
jgi:signal transduction histidine kinase